MLVMDMVMEGWLTIGDQGGGGVQHGACHGCKKEVTKVVEEVNKEMVNEVNEGLLLVCRCGDVVLDKEADVEVHQEGDKEVAHVVNKFSHVGTV